MTAFQHLSPEQARPMIEQEEAVVVDIRDQVSFEAGHIQGAQPLTNDNLPEFLQKTDKDKPVIVCCYHGNSSQQAAQFLSQQDFTRVFSLDGGFEYWKGFAPDLCQNDR